MSTRSGQAMRRGEMRKGNKSSAQQCTRRSRTRENGPTLYKEVEAPGKTMHNLFSRFIYLSIYK